MTDLSGKTAAYQQLIEGRGIAMDVRFGLLDGLPTPTEDQGDSE